jgi:hypothetical protein
MCECYRAYGNHTPSKICWAEYKKTWNDYVKTINEKSGSANYNLRYKKCPYQNLPIEYNY